MRIIDRNSDIHAKEIIENLIPEYSLRIRLIEFLCSAIEYANNLNSANWNLNLDKNGNFIRFNTGQQYCIQIYQDELLILCERISLKQIIVKNELPVIFRGHQKQKRIQSKNIDEVPDCVAKTKNSIGCVFKLTDCIDYLELIKESNFFFIKQALKTLQLPRMKNAHSKGAINYFSNTINRLIPNPLFELTNFPTINEIIVKQDLAIEKAKKLTSEKRKIILEKSQKKPEKIVVSQTLYNRNQYVVAEVLYRANGICEKCKQPAPFLRDSDNSPYLEVHHIVPLSENGDDTIENAFALCPNCHRKAHYGKKYFDNE